MIHVHFCHWSHSGRAITRTRCLTLGPAAAKISRVEPAGAQHNCTKLFVLVFHHELADFTQASDFRDRQN